MSSKRARRDDYEDDKVRHGDRDGDRRRYDSRREDSPPSRSKNDDYRKDDDYERERSRRRDQDYRSDDHDRERSRKHDRSSSSKRPRETSEERSERKAKEKAARKAEKKAEKKAEAERARAESERQLAAQLSVYSGQDNPFNDANLDKQFVWRKKKEMEKKKGLTEEEIRIREAQRRIDAREELSKLEQRRIEREREAELREADALRMARLQESSQMAEWIAKEDDFHLDQARKRAEIRIKDNRAKPIDLLAMNLKWSTRQIYGETEDGEEDEGIGLDIDLEEPYLIFENLVLEEMDELKEDIKMHLALEKTEANLEFWRSMLIVCDDEIEKLRDKRSGVSYTGLNRNNPAVMNDITNMLKDKSFDELQSLQRQVTTKLQSEEKIDVEYWESLLKELIVWKAKAKLRDMHKKVLANRLEHLRERQRDEALRAQAELTLSMDAGTKKIKEEEIKEEEDDIIEEVDVKPIEPWNPSFTPSFVEKVTEDEQNLTVVDEVQDIQNILKARQRVAQSRFVPRKQRNRNAADKGKERKKDENELLYQTKVEEGLDSDEEIFEMEEDLGEFEVARQGSYTWEDKYRPRKPRYFNKVHVGYDWNKYNQTHYDTDNPPPKVIQGYKFNIFYPDLIDKRKTPTYKIIRRKENEDTCTLVFTAGPPYEDLAFTIVNREWEYSHKRGFRSTFDRGVLQLHVTFKRLHYRK